MSDAIREYDGMFFFAVSEEVRSSIEVAARRVGLEILVSAGWVEFRYAGRDSNRFVVELLREFAAVIGEAEGEIVCRHGEDEGADPRFEFYSVRGGELWRQDGVIVRGERGPA